MRQQIRRRLELPRWLLAVLAAALLPTAAAQADPAPGSPLPAQLLPRLDGTGSLDYRGGQPANLFLFFRPEQPLSQVMLGEVATCLSELQGHPVGGVAIVSDHYSRADAEAALARSGLALPLLLDVGDQLYGKLGLILHPILGIADQQGRLVALQPHVSVQFCARVRGYVLRALGEIDQAQLDGTLQPPRSAMGGEAQVARRNLRLAQRHLAAGHRDQALLAVQKSLQHDPGLAPAHALLGTVLAGRGDCPGARPAFARALELDPTLTEAQEGQRACAAKKP